MTATAATAALPDLIAYLDRLSGRAPLPGRAVPGGRRLGHGGRLGFARAGQRRPTAGGRAVGRFRKGEPPRAGPRATRPTPGAPAPAAARKKVGARCRRFSA